jgi:hypothetical protein
MMVVVTVMIVTAVMIVVAPVAAVPVTVLVVVHVDTGRVAVGGVRVPSLIARAMRTGRLRQRTQQEESSGTNHEKDRNRPT